MLIPCLIIALTIPSQSKDVFSQVTSMNPSKGVGIFNMINLHPLSGKEEIFIRYFNVFMKMKMCNIATKFSS